MSVDVASFLTDSRSAHERARRARQQKDATTARIELTAACRLREAAHAADPEHTDPAWQTDQAVTPGHKDTHEALMTFYREQGIA